MPDKRQDQGSNGTRAPWLADTGAYANNTHTSTPNRRQGLRGNKLLVYTLGHVSQQHCTSSDHTACVWSPKRHLPAHNSPASKHAHEMQARKTHTTPKSSAKGTGHSQKEEVSPTAVPCGLRLYVPCPLLKAAVLLHKPATWLACETRPSCETRLMDWTDLWLTLGCAHMVRTTVPNTRTGFGYHRMRETEGPTCSTQKGDDILKRLYMSTLPPCNTLSTTPLAQCGRLVKAIEHCNC